MKPTEIRQGNLICYDHNEHRNPPVTLVREFVKEIHEDGVLFMNGEKRPFDRLAGLPLSDELLSKYGKMEVTKDPHVPGSPDLISFRITDNIFILKWISNKDVSKDTYIMQIGQVALDSTELDFVHQLQNLYLDITEEEIKPLLS